MKDNLEKIKKEVSKKIKNRKKINKDSFIKFLVNEGFYRSKKEASTNLTKIIEGIELALEKGYDVQFSGFGKFGVRSRIIRGGNDKLTGKSANTVAIIPTLEAGKNLKEKIRKAILEKD